MEKIKKLSLNTLIFAIGNFGSKIMVFLLVPLYTHFLEPEQLGVADLIVTTVLFCIPITTLSIADAVMRFGMETADSKAILNTAMVIVYIQGIVLFILAPFTNKIPIIGEYYHYFALLIFFQSVYIIFQQYVRAQAMVKLFAASSIFSAIVLTGGMLLFLKYFSMGISGFLLAQIISFVAGAIFLFVRSSAKLSIGKLNTKLLKEMLRYSMPLIPNAMTWGVIQLSDRFVISFFLGAGVTGMYAIAVKFPNLINVFGSIFFQAWQLSVLENKENRKVYMRQGFTIFTTFLFISISFFISYTKLLVSMLLSSEYHSVWTFIPFLMVGSLFSSFSAFIATNYLVEKNTKVIFKTTLIGACINLLLNMLFIPLIGLQGAGLSTLISFLIIFILRAKREDGLKKMMFKGNFYISSALILFQAAVLSFNVPILSCQVVQHTFTLVIVLVNIPIFLFYWKKVKGW